MSNFIEDIISEDLSCGRVKNVVTRFPPEPNGYLHIGHAKAICLNVALAKKFGGKCNLRFDDTNPVKEDDEFVASIVGDVKWLGWEGDVLFASDYFDTMYACAVRLIEAGKAYVDDITPDQMRAMRGTLTEPGIPSPRRDRPAAESLALFEEMRAGKVADGALVLRAKIDMASPNINLRDPIIYRVVKARHHRQGERWNIYPMYDFAHPIEDAVEGVTHSVCTLEFEDHRPLYDWVLRECGFRNPPRQYEFARLNIERTIMSKRYLKKLVDEGAVDGWDDPRMPTLAGLRRRGYTASSIREFCDRIGVAKANSEVEAGQLESCIREELNLSAPRVMAVLDPLELDIVGSGEFCEEIELENNPSDPAAGTRKVRFTDKLWIERDDFALDPPPKYHRLTKGGVVRLKGACIVRCTGCETGPDGRPTKVYAEIVEGTRSGQESPVKAKGVIHWVSRTDAVDVEARLYDYLLLDAPAGTDFSERMNPDSLIVRRAKGEPLLSGAKPFDSFQFMRQGYFCRDCKADGPVYNLIVGLKDGFKKQK